jgi:uncharacterized protein (DUF983 family)
MEWAPLTEIKVNGIIGVHNISYIRNIFSFYYKSVNVIRNSLTHRCPQGGEGRGRRGVPHVHPQKTFCNIKNTKIEDPLPHFFTTP